MFAKRNNNALHNFFFGVPINLDLIAAFTVDRRFDVSIIINIQHAVRIVAKLPSGRREWMLCRGENRIEWQDGNRDTALNDGEYGERWTVTYRECQLIDSFRLQCRRKETKNVYF